MHLNLVRPAMVWNQEMDKVMLQEIVGAAEGVLQTSQTKIREQGNIMAKGC